ncbi:MAG: hypothetical protein AB7O62_15815 [Pirellulales bacterium]
MRLRARFSAGVGGLLALLAVLGFPCIAAAGEPRVAFDLGYTAICQDVSPPGFEQVHPGERVVEAVFRVSMVLADGSEDDIESIMLVIESPPRRLRVVDFLPKTQLGSDFAAPIDVLEKDDTIRTLEAEIAGSASVPLTPGAAQVTPRIVSKTSHQTGTQQAYKRLPAQSLLLAAGTVKGENGVFFKLRPSSQTSLEGARDFAVRFIVPRDWRGDWAVLSGTVQTKREWYESSKNHRPRMSRMFVGLYQEGDEEARLAAEEMAQAQGRLVDRVTGGSAQSIDVASLIVNPPAKKKSSSLIPTLARVYDDTFNRSRRPDNNRAESKEYQLRQSLLNVGQFSAR